MTHTELDALQSSCERCTSTTETAVYDADGHELARYDGVKEVRGKDFKNNLPIKCKVIKTFTYEVAQITIEAHA